MLGKTTEDQLIVDRFVWGKDIIESILSLVVENKNNPAKLMSELNRLWEKSVRGRLLDYENEARPNEFYLGYLSIIDFMIHEIFHYYKDIFQREVNLFPKLVTLRNKVASLEPIKNFEASERTVKGMCPLDFYRNWKLETMKP